MKDKLEKHAEPETAAELRQSVAADVRLLPCPFCGSKKLELKDIPLPTASGRKLCRVRCKNCTASGPIEYFDDLKQWNLRA